MKKLSALFVLVLALAMTASPTRTQSRVAVPQALADRAAAGETLSVIVGVDATFVPEGYLDGVDAVSSQRDGITQALDDVMARAAAAGAADARRFDYIPYFVATVGRASLEQLAAMPGVRSIEENSLDQPHLLQSAPFVNAPAAWTAGATGAGWRVAVLDTGVLKTHPFLSGKVSAEACFSGGSTGGTSFCPGGVPASSAPGSGEPCTGIAACDHGTHVAGIAAGTNGQGGSHGVARGAGVIAIQVFSRFTGANCSGTSPCALSAVSDQISALTHVYNLAGPGNVNQIAAVNMSLGGGQYFNYCDGVQTARKAAIDNLLSRNVATVISSGNNGFRTSMGAPACISTAISVGSTLDTALAVSDFSNNAPFLKLYAPGSNIVSSVFGNAYASYNGTSMAAPHVAGAWAVLKQAVPAASPLAVLTALTNTGSMVVDQRSSGGAPHPMINVNAARQALVAVFNPPGAPTGLTATVNGNQLMLSWTAPASGGGVSGYALAVTQSPIGGGNIQVGAGTSFAANVPNGAYVLSVRAFNAAGAGPTSNVVSFNVPVLPAPPGSPTNLVANVVGNSASFTWNAPASGGPVAGYVLQAGTSPAFVTPILATPLPATPRSFAVGGIPPGNYYVRVYAQNAGGTSPFYSNEVLVSIAGPQPPGIPTMNAPTVVGNTATLSWAAGGGGAATSYQLSVTGSATLTQSFAGTSVAIPGVPPGTYFLRVRAVNALGASAFSNQVTLVVP